MIMLTKEQVAELLREAFDAGALGPNSPESLSWFNSEPYIDERERAIQPLVHRSSGGHDDHGREVNLAVGVQAAETYRDRPSHHVLRGHESQPCWCWADSDHRIGEEVRRKGDQSEDKS